MTLHYDFKDDYKIIIDRLIQSKYGHNIQSADLEDALLSLGSFIRRLPPTQVWTVIESDVFNPCGHEKEIDAIKMRLTTGIDIKPYLSKTSKKYSYKDILLNNWDILHLHLGDTLGSDGYISRTNDLLYCRFDRKSSIAYFIVIQPHGAWTNKSLLEVIDRNWPESIKEFYIADGQLVAPEPDEKALYTLSINNINALIEINGKVYAPPGLGHAADGSALIDVLYMQQGVRLFKDTHKIFDNYLEQIKSNLITLTKEDDIQIHLTSFDVEDDKISRINFMAIMIDNSISFSFDAKIMEDL
ncbi:MAG: hypothetical protein VB025_08265 [Sphaerochaeta sp.]|nr:hypothetical protein [Sphaerochaeta sp.]